LSDSCKEDVEFRLLSPDLSEETLLECAYQWSATSSEQLLITLTDTRSPSLTKIEGPGNWPFTVIKWFVVFNR
jgi:hypothetical protein